MISNSLKKEIKKLKLKKYRRQLKRFTVEGKKNVAEALCSEYHVLTVITDRKRKKETRELLALARSQNVSLVECDNKELTAVKTTTTFPGIMAIVEIKSTRLSDILDRKIICLDQIKDPGNLGTIIRTADWFGIKNIILSQNSVDVYNDKVVRSTMGSIFHCNIYISDDLEKDLKQLKNTGYKIRLFTTEGKNISKLSDDDKSIMVFGSESHGLSQTVKILGEKYTIPGAGEAESLNIAIAAGIVMYKLS